jgi:hypothetical protein
MNMELRISGREGDKDEADFSPFHSSSCFPDFHIQNPN